MAEIATIARPYAEAVFGLAEANGQFGSWSARLARLAQAVAHPDVRACIGNPNVSAAQLTDLLVSAMGERVSAETQNFVHLVVANRRLEAVGEIGELYERMVNERQGVVEGLIASAFPLDETQLSELVASLERRFKRKVEPQVTVDKALIGGITVTVGDEVIDGSVRGKLAAMSAALLKS